MNVCKLVNLTCLISGFISHVAGCVQDGTAVCEADLFSPILCVNK